MLRFVTLRGVARCSRVRFRFILKALRWFSKRCSFLFFHIILKKILKSPNLGVLYYAYKYTMRMVGIYNVYNKTKMIVQCHSELCICYGTQKNQRIALRFKTIIIHGNIAWTRNAFLIFSRIGLIRLLTLYTIRINQVFINSYATIKNTFIALIWLYQNFIAGIGTYWL